MEIFYSRGALPKVLGISKPRVDQLAKRLPPPDCEIDEGGRVKPAWRRETIEAWNRKRLKENGLYGKASK